MAFRYALPALAVAGSAVAQSCGGGSSSTTTIQNGGDASALGSCQTYSGSIAIATGTTDDIDFGSLRGISGSLTASQVDQLTSISGASLETIGDSFTLENVQILSTLNFPRLTQVGALDWTGLPNLGGLSMTSGLSQADSVTIINTGLTSLDGINLESVDTFVVTNNNFLTQISMQVKSISDRIELAANGRDVQAEFPNLQWAYNMTLANVSSIDIPSLSSVNGSLGFYSNFIESVSAPNLTNVGGGLAFVANADLTNASFPELTTVGGGLLIANNTAFEEITGFPALRRVGGAIDFSGNFTTVELPELNDVRGAMNLQSSEQINSVCNYFQPLAASNSVIRGPYSCAGERSNPGREGSLSDGTSSGSGGDSAESSSAASYRYISGATGVMGVIAAMFGML